MAIFLFLLGIPLGTLFYIVGLQCTGKITIRGYHPTCSKCDHSLKFKELLFGKCCNCGAKPACIYIITVLMTTILFVLSYMKFGFQPEIIISLFLIALLMIILVSDISYMIIPNKILLFFLPIFIIGRILFPLDPWWSSIFGACLGFVIILIFILVSRGAIGAGDMKLFGLLGIVLGVKKILLTFILAAIIGTVIGFILLIFKLIDRKQDIPFGPYIVIGSLIAYFYGNHMIQWYIHL